MINSGQRVHLTPLAGTVLAGVCMAICYRRAAAFPPTAAPAQPDWWVGAYAFLSVIGLRALQFEVSSSSSTPRASMPPPPPPPLVVPRLLRPALVLLAFGYAFGGPLLGVHDLGACNMYSNLRMYGGSNHLLLPTGMIGAVWPEATTLVRVEASTSEYMNSIYPGEITSQMAPAERALLVAAGHSGHMFNGMKARILGPDFAPADAKFFRYTVTALELRRLLREARTRNEAFEITYTHLDAAGGDEQWRREAPGRTITHREDGLGTRMCVVRCGPLGMFSCACAADELPLKPPPSYWPSKTLIQQPYPILEDAHKWEGELVCFGP